MRARFVLSAVRPIVEALESRCLLDGVPLAPGACTVPDDPLSGQNQVYPEPSMPVDDGSGGSRPLSADLSPLSPTTPAASAPRLLIIAADAFASASSLNSFISLKRGQGWAVDAASTGVVGGSPVQIQGYIKSRYANVSTRPSALLLVGDTDLLPAWTGITPDAPDTDLYYTTMDGADDWMSEFPVGRFSVTSVAQLDNVVRKTLEYETAAPAPWMHKAAFLAGNDQYGTTENTHNWVIDHYLAPLGYTSDRLYRHTYGATADQVTAAFNDGRALGVYSGHGAVTSWADGPVYTAADVNALTNVGMYPFVASFACITGQYSAPESLAETWQRAPNGAVAVLASSVDSYWDEDDLLERKLFEAIFDEHQLTFGGAILRAKQLYLQQNGLGIDQTTRRYFEMYNLFGDPTAQLVGQDLGILTAADLPNAYTREAATLQLTAAGGMTPYTWSLVSGSLPPGLSLASDGTISGTAESVGASTFTVQVIDAAGVRDSRELRLSVVDRLEMTTPSPLPGAAAGQDYHAVFQASGGSGSYTWAAVDPGRFDERHVATSWIDGGTPMGWRDDDASWRMDLPWAFDFYGTTYHAVNISSNGFLDFGHPDDNYRNTQADLKTNIRVAPFWDDLNTAIAPGDDVYVTNTADYVVIRWAAHSYGVPVNAEVVLYRNGNIAFNYRDAVGGLNPTAGLSAGDSVHFTIASVDGSDDVAAGSCLFEYHPWLPPGLSLDPVTGMLSGVVGSVGDYAFAIRATDSASPPQILTRSFALSVSELPSLSLSLPTSATEGDGHLAAAGVVSILAASPVDLVVTLASSRPQRIAIPSTVTIPAGQTSAAFDLDIPDNVDLDGPEDITITASADGYVSGTAAITIHDDETAVLSLSLPQTARESDGLLAGAGVLTASAAPARDILVSLRSDNLLELSVPPTVVLRAGTTSTRFDLTIVHDAVIDGDQTVNLAASVENWSGATASMRVLDVDRTLAVILPRRATEGDGLMAGAGIVRLGGATPADVTIHLAFSDHSELIVPATVFIPAGQDSASFDLNVLDDNDCDGAQVATVTATADGFPLATAAISIADNEVHHFGFSAVPSPQVQGRPFELTVSARDLNDAPIPNYSGTVTLTAAGALGAIPMSPANAVWLSDGSWTGTVTLNGADTHVIIRADDGQGHTGAGNPFDLVPPPAITTPVTLPSAAINHPYSLALQASGGIGPYAWSVLEAGEYAETPLAGNWIGGDSAMNWRDDDRTWNLDLPWPFPFYGTAYSSVHVSSNGFLDFTSPSDAWGNSQQGLQSSVRIAPLWDDLSTVGAGADIFVLAGTDSTTIRWAARTYNSTTSTPSVNFEAVLYRNGDIAFNYGQVGGDLTATVGVSAGDGTHYTLASIDSADVIPSNSSLLFRYQLPLPPGLSLDRATGVLSGTPTVPGSYTVTVTATDSGTPALADQRDFRLDVAPAPGIAGTDADDRFDITVDPAGQNVLVYLNDPALSGIPLATFPLASLGALDIDGLAGNDRFIIRMANGSPVPSAGLNIIGGEGDDQLLLLGTPTAAAAYAPDPSGPGRGTVIVGGRAVWFDELEPADLPAADPSMPLAVNVSAFATLTLVTPAADDALTVEQRPGGWVCITGASGNAALAGIAVFNTASLILDVATNDRGGGDDSITVRQSGAGAWPSLKVLAGTGNNSLTLQGVSISLDASPGLSGSLDLALNAATVELPSSQHYTSLSVSAGSHAKLLQGGDKVLLLGKLSMDPTGAFLDLADNRLVLQAGDADPAAVAAQVATYVQAGLSASGTSSAITSLASFPGADGLKGLAVLLNDRGDGQRFLSSFAGLPVDAHSILVAYTWNGDTDLNGRIDADDYFRLDRGLLRQLSGYANGDFNGNRRIDADDYQLIDAAFRAQPRPLIKSPKAATAGHPKANRAVKPAGKHPPHHARPKRARSHAS